MTKPIRRAGLARGATETGGSPLGEICHAGARPGRYPERHREPGIGSGTRDPISPEVPGISGRPGGDSGTLDPFDGSGKVATNRPRQNEQ